MASFYFLNRSRPTIDAATFESFFLPISFLFSYVVFAAFFFCYCWACKEIFNLESDLAEFLLQLHYRHFGQIFFLRDSSISEWFLLSVFMFSDNYLQFIWCFFEWNSFRANNEYRTLSLFLSEICFTLSWSIFVLTSIEIIGISIFHA